MQTTIYVRRWMSVVVTVVAAAILSSMLAISSVSAQERVPGASTAGAESPERAVEAVAVPARAVETNVCDGVTCPDGSCAPTSEACAVEPGDATTACAADRPIRCPDGSCRRSLADCPVVEANDASPATPGEIDAAEEVGSAAPARVRDTDTDGDSDDDGLDDGSERAQNHNSSRSNRTTSVAAPELDTDSDDDGDGVGDGTERANYNNTRSNRSTVRSPEGDLDSDDDGDGVPTEAARAERDAASPLLFKLGEGDHDGDGYGDPTVLAAPGDAPEAGYLRIKGIKGEVEASESGEPRLRRLSVQGDAVRQWSEEERVAFRELRSTLASGTPAYAGARVAAAVLENDRIESVELDEAGARMQYRAQLRWFGLIPSEQVVSATTAASGQVSIDYPWYSFLASTPDTETIRTTLSSLQPDMLMTLTADPI